MRQTWLVRVTQIPCFNWNDIIHCTWPAPRLVWAGVCFGARLTLLNVHRGLQWESDTSPSEVLWGSADGKEGLSWPLLPDSVPFPALARTLLEKAKNRGAQLYRSKRRRGNMVFQVSGWGVFSELTAPSRGRGECLFTDKETILVVNMKHLLYFQGRSLPRRRSAKEKPLMLHPLGRQGELIVT